MSWKASDAVDYKGFHADKSKTGGWIPAALILGIEICERLSTMGIAVNLVTYLIGTMHLPSAESANIVTDFMGTSFMLCLLGGFLADSFLGRYLTIAIFSVVQAMGTGLLAVLTCLPQLRPPPCNGGGGCQRAGGFQMGMFYMSLYVVALGTGGLKSSVSGFGTDQFDDGDEKERTHMNYFFNRFFFFISTGTLLAVTVLVYIQDRVGRSWAYAICCISMVVAVAVFLSGTKRYRYKRSSGSPTVHILQVLVAALRKRSLKCQPCSMISCLYEDHPEETRIHHTNQFRFLDKAAIMEEGDDDRWCHGARKINSANPWRLCSVTRVEEVKMMINLLPVWATTILFWTIYAQMITFSVEQAATMDRSIGSRGFQIPAGSTTVFFVGAILITLALYDRLLMPWWSKRRGTPGFSNLQKIGIGLVLSAAGMAVAALVEVKRLAVARQTAPSAAAHQGSGSTAALPISVFALIPQFFLVGTGEAFIYTGQLDFFITRSPKGMKAVSTGLFLSTISLGFFLSSLLVSVVKAVTGGVKDGNGWLGDSINTGRLDCFYGLLAALSAVNLAAYLACTIRIRPPPPPPQSSSKEGGVLQNTGMKSVTVKCTSAADDKC